MSNIEINSQCKCPRMATSLVYLRKKKNMLWPNNSRHGVEDEIKEVARGQVLQSCREEV